MKPMNSTRLELSFKSHFVCLYMYVCNYVRMIIVQINMFNQTELKWIKLLQTPFPLGFKDNIYQQGNISKMPDFDVFSLFDIRR